MTNHIGSINGNCEEQLTSTDCRPTVGYNYKYSEHSTYFDGSFGTYLYPE